MDDFKLCSDGEFMPVSLPCPPPYSGPYYYYPYENIPLPPEQGNTVYPVSSSKPISSGAVAAIIIIVGFIFFIMCLIALKFRTRFILSNIVRVSRRNARSNELSGEFLVNNGDMHLVNIVGCGLEEKLVNLLPVCEYVGLMKEGKEGHECAVCLSLFEEKEIVRVLPKCHHIFHLQCIDKWFESHANCPLCREKITLQTIQLSFNPPKQINIHDQQPLGPPIDIPHQHLNDQHHLNSPPLRDAYLHNVNNQLDGSLACDHLQDPDPHQNIVVAGAASATSCIDFHPNPAQAADQPNHLIADDRKRKAAGFTCNFEGLCDQTTIPIPAATAESMKYQHDAGSKVGKNVSNKAAAIRDAYCINIGVGQSAGPVCAPYDHQNRRHRSHGAADDRRTARSQREFNNIGYFFNPNKSPEDHAGHTDDHKLLLSMTSSTYNNPSTRSLSLLRKSLSTGSLFESDAKASHAFHGTTREML